MRAQLFKSCKMTPYELILSKSIFPYIQYIRKYGVYTVMCCVYTVYGIPEYNLGQPYSRVKCVCVCVIVCVTTHNGAVCFCVCMLMCKCVRVCECVCV
jgi:hypothetical protein